MSQDMGTRHGPRMRRVYLATAAAVLLTLTTAVAVSLVRSSDDRPLVLGQADEVFPSGDLRDVASFADHVAIITVLSERERPMSAEEQAAGEGYAPREITLRFEKPLWSRAGAPPLPADATIDALGWSVKGSEKVPLVSGNGPRLEVGARFLSPLVLIDGTWSPYSYTTVLPLKGDTITGIGRPRSSYIIGERAVGETVEDFVTSLRSTEPYPVAAANASLSARERLALVRADEEANQAKTDTEP